MTIETRGTKRICPSCGARFYDLGKNPAHCPKCSTAVDNTIQVKPRRRAKAVIQVDEDEPLLKAKKDAAKKPAKEMEDIDLEEFDDIETLDGDAEIEEIEEIEDIDTIEEIEDMDENAADDDENLAEDILAEDEDIGDDALIDNIDEVEEEEEDEPKAETKTPKRKK